MHWQACQEKCVKFFETDEIYRLIVELGDACYGVYYKTKHVIVEFIINILSQF